MKKNRRYLGAIVASLAITALALTGCTGQSGTPKSSVDPDAPVTITLSNQPPATQKADLAAYLKLIDDFEAAHPNVTVKGSEIAWDPKTFPAQLAGGQLPTIMAVPFTEPQGLIARHQVVDITRELEQIGLKDQLNPAALPVAEDAHGNIYGVPIDAYALGIVYNRDLFKRAGLDPDDPPKTWSEVRAAAKTIAEMTGATGYAQMTTNGQGGWTLTSMTYAAGGSVESADGSKVTFTDTPAMRKQLELLHDMRWADNSMGSNFVYDQAGALQDFAAGRVGMVIGAPIAYQFCTQLFGMDGSAFGLGSMPQGKAAGGSLSGGLLQVVSPKATPEQRLAAVEFIAFRLRQVTDKATAVEAAKAAAAAGTPVGLPGLSPLKDSFRQRYLKWVKDYINVPLDHFAPYEATINKITLKSEPASDAQEVYAALDPVIQAVLTKENTDIPALLGSAKSTVKALLKR